MARRFNGKRFMRSVARSYSKKTAKAKRFAIKRKKR